MENPGKIKYNGDKSKKGAVRDDDRKSGKGSAGAGKLYPLYARKAETPLYHSYLSARADHPSEGF